MQKPLTARELTKRIKEIDENLSFDLKNIRINGVLKGCSGFIFSEETGKFVYVLAEIDNYVNKAMYRIARHGKDYSGGHSVAERNRYAEYSNLAKEIVELLEWQVEYDERVK